MDTQKPTSKHKQVPTEYEHNFLCKLDKRMEVTRELLSKFDLICGDLGGGRTLSYLQQSLIQRFLFLEYHLQDTERRVVAGEDVDVGKWVQSINSIQGLIAKLGLDRKPKNIFDDLDAVISS